MRLLALLKTLLPGRDFAIDYAWSGAFATSKSSLPIIGPIPDKPRCLSILGCGGNGVTFSMVAAEIAVAWAQGKKDQDIDLFSL